MFSESPKVEEQVRSPADGPGHFFISLFLVLVLGPSDLQTHSSSSPLGLLPKRWNCWTTSTRLSLQTLASVWGNGEPWQRLERGFEVGIFMALAPTSRHMCPSVRHRFSLKSSFLHKSLWAPETISSLPGLWAPFGCSFAASSSGSMHYPVRAPYTLPFIFEIFSY